MEILDHQTRNEIRLNSLLKLSQMNEKTYQEVMDFGLQEAIMLTDSKIGYIYHYDESSELFTLYSWSKSAIEQCKVMEQQTSYELQKTGLWGEAVRQRKPIVTNDYNAPNRYKKGYPYGHVHVTSHLNLPILRHDKIVAVIGVGNKETGYTEDDVKQLQLFMDSLWSITERKRIEQELQESEQKFRTLADFTYDWVYWMSPDLDITYSSPSCERISGYTPEEFINDSNLISSIVHPDDLELYRSHVTMTYHPDSRGNLEEIEFRIITKKGEEKWIAHACRAVFGKEGKFMGRRVSNRDITDKKHSELMLVQSSQDINMLNDNILQMLRVMSHDIRSPLISMAATLKLLQKGRYGNIDASASNTVMDLLIRVHQLLGIADDCLGKASAVDSLMKMEKTAIDLRQEVIDVVLDELSNEIEEKK